MEILKVNSKAFKDGDWMPIKYTARGEDLSPDFELEGIAQDAKSIAITLDDASHPLFPNYNHWVIWNIPVQAIIHEGISHGKTVESLGGAIQGRAYGRNRYKGPKPPLKSIHTYVFTIYILDQMVDIKANSKKLDLLSAMSGNILQQTTFSGKFQSHVSNH